MHAVAPMPGRMRHGIRCRPAWRAPRVALSGSRVGFVSDVIGFALLGGDRVQPLGFELAADAVVLGPGGQRGGGALCRRARRRALGTSPCYYPRLVIGIYD